VAFACLFIPDFPVQAVVRLEPELREKAVVVLEGAAPLTRVFAVNAVARALGVELGMTKVQAEALGEMVWRWRSSAQEATAHRALLDCAWTISPRVEDKLHDTGRDELRDAVVLDLAGCEKLFGSHEKIVGDLQRTAASVGFDTNVAVAGNPEAAVCAARGFAGITIIVAGEESQKLGTLPVSALPMSLEFLETLARWGIRTCAQFAALPEVAVVERFGQDGRRWQLLAQGAEPRPLMAREPELQFEECMELDFAVELLDQLLFVLNRLLEQLCVRLRMHVLATSEVRVTLTLDTNRGAEEEQETKSDKKSSRQTNRNGSRGAEVAIHERTLRLPVPARESKFLLKLLKLDLEAHPPGAPVLAVKMVAVPTRSRARQMGLYLPLSPEPEKLEVTLARLRATVGESRVGAPVLLDTHRPNAFRQDKFVLPEIQEKKAMAKSACSNACVLQLAAMDTKSAEHVQRSFVSFDAEKAPARTPALPCPYPDSEANALRPVAASALRIYRPALAATVELHKAKPARLVCDGAQRRVLSFAGPWRTKGDWWSETAWARDEWDVVLHALRPKIHKDSGREDEEETAVYRIYRDLRSRHWFVEGIYD
jgi:protein ImuB